MIDEMSWVLASMLAVSVAGNLLQLGANENLKEDRDYWKNLCDDRTKKSYQLMDKVAVMKDNIRRLRNAVVNKSKCK